MKSKKTYFKILSSIVIAVVFIFLQFGSGDKSSSNETELSKTKSESIIKIISKNEIKSKTDISGGQGIGEVEISLKMNEDKTFKYAMVESFINNSRNSMNASGTYELIGSVNKENSSGWTNKYGEDVGKFQYVQVIKFSGKTNEGNSLNLTAKLVQFGDKNSLENKWFFSNEDYSSNISETVGLKNFTLPTSDIYP